MDDNTSRTLEEFTKDLAGRIEQHLLESYGVSASVISQPVLKTNVIKQGITVHFEGSDVAPTVYADEEYKAFCEENATISEIVEKLSKKAYLGRTQKLEQPELTPEEAKKHVTLTLVNTDQNQEMLAKTPHMEILGGELSAIPRWYISEEASFVVSNNIASHMGLTPDEVIQIGQQHINSQHFEAKPMREILMEMMGVDNMDMMPPAEGPEMIVLTSESKIQGSNALLSEKALNQVHEMLGSDYVILPSSIHEVICVPITDEMNPDELRAMVHDVNGTQVAPEERLSENIMMYDGQKLSLVGDSFQMETPKVNIKMDSESIRFAM